MEGTGVMAPKREAPDTFVALPYGWYFCNKCDTWSQSSDHLSRHRKSQGHKRACRRVARKEQELFLPPDIVTPGGCSRSVPSPVKPEVESGPSHDPAVSVVSAETTGHGTGNEPHVSTSHDHSIDNDLFGKGECSGAPEPFVDPGPLLPKYPIDAPSIVTDADERDEPYSWEQDDSQPLSEAAATTMDHSSPEAMPAVRISYFMCMFDQFSTSRYSCCMPNGVGCYRTLEIYYS